MKKIILTIIGITFFMQAKPCDICGCGVGGNYIGILPEFSKHIFGLRYRYNSILTHLGAGGETSYLTTSEQYQTTELWGGWNISKKFRLMAAVPYSFNERTNQGISQTKNGIGDITINGFYQLLNNKKVVHKDKLLVQSLWIGGGVKLPTGHYDPADKGNTAQSANLFQLGTGSVDFTVNAMYDIRLQDMGINVSANYKMNTTNKYEYTYGNKLSSTAQLYYKFRIKKALTIAPNIGLMYENSKKDFDHAFPVDISGGDLLAGTLGLETVCKKIAIGGNWQTPISQNLANGSVQANNRMMVHVSFML